jgi:hypothetical protein
MGEWSALVWQTSGERKTVVAAGRKQQKGFVLVPA